MFRIASRLCGGLLFATLVWGCSAAGATPSSSTKPSANASAVAPSPSPNKCESAGEPSKGFKYLTCTIEAPSLANNVLADPAVLKIAILLPEGYDASAARYPVVYVLAGFQDMGDALAGQMLTRLADGGAARGAILVFAGAVNALQGSFYMNSPVTGNWDDAIAKDLVGYVDSHYRTLASAASRGIAGHSMGGHGALAVGMRHPDLFGVIYAISPGLFDADGFQARLGGAADPAQIEAVTAMGKRLAALPAADRSAAFIAEANGAASDLQFELAYGTAFAPDTQSSIMMKWPYKLENGKVVRDDAVYKLWEGGFGGLADRITTYGSGLKALRGFVIEYGTYDQFAWIPTGSHAFVTLLKAAGIPVTENEFEGDHVFALGDRLANYMLPYMLQKLATS